jgi:ABC-type phosphate/phosphonate transport system substrate-binding protein
LIPLNFLAENGLNPRRDFAVTEFDRLLGKHGDHIGGERDAVSALLKGEADAACILDANLLAFGREGTLPSGSTRVLAQTPTYDHCNFTILEGAPGEPVARFRELLLEMSYSDPAVRPLLDLEGLKRWLPGRIDGYGQLTAAVQRFGTIEAFVERLAGQWR